MSAPQKYRGLTQYLFLAATTALLVAWVIEPVLMGGGWGPRMVTVVATFALATGFLQTKSEQSKRAAQAVQRHIENLCRLEHHNLVDPSYAAPQIDDNPHWQGTLGSVHDCIARFSRQAHDADHQRAGAEARFRRLSAELEQAREILAAIPDPVVAVDSYGELILANPSAERVLNFTWDNDQHPQLTKVIASEALIELVNETRRRKTPAQRSGEIILEDQMGGSCWFRVACRSLSNLHDRESIDQQNGNGAVAVLSDISSQKVAQKRNAEFVSAVSHEMKTPLTSIKAYVEMLADGDAEDEETRDSFLEVITSQTDRLQRLIDNILNLARIEAGVVEVKKSPRSLNELLEEAVNIVRPASEQKNIQLLTDLSPLYLGVLADRDMLLQAAINLLSNAIKYTPEGGKVSVRSRLNDNEVQFDVEDTGVGLSDEDCQRVFEKFYRVKKDQQMASGTGLGLPLAKHIVEDVHSGKLTVTSVLGTGSTFRISLPGTGRQAT